MKLENRRFLQSEEGRKWLIEQTLEVVPKEKNWQSFHTPYDLCEYMVSKTTLEGKSILVLFNVEFLKVLIHKFGVSNKNITFLADCRIESELAAKVYKVNNSIVNSINDIEKELKQMKTFDLCFSNPPYKGDTDFKIIKQVFPLCTEMIIVHPAAWLLDNKNLPRSYFTKYKKVIENCCESSYIFDGNSVFGIVGPCSPFTIFKLNKNHIGNISVNYFNEQFYEVDSVYDITVFGKDWVSLVKPFVEKLKTYPNIWDHPQRIEKIQLAPKDKFYFQCRSQIPGTGGKDVYNCLIQLDSLHERYINQYNNLVEDKTIKFYFNSENEVHNFIEFLKTDFVRFCIECYKSNENLHRGELRLIPWLDFRESWNDEKLYRFFNIESETINYITNLFSDDLFGLRGES